MTTQVANDTPPKRLSVTIPGELVAPLETMAAREDRSVGAQIINIVRRYFERIDDENRAYETRLREAIAAADRGEVVTIPEGGLEAAMEAMDRGASADEVMGALTGAR
jgi:hypothetical protein